MNLNKFLLVILIGCFVTAAGQPKTYTSKAKSHEDRNHFYEASRMYRGLHDRGDRESALNAAMNLYKAHRYEEALPYFHISDSISLINDVDEIFAYFECLKAIKNYKAADDLVKTHVKNYANRREFTLHDDKLSYYDKLASYKRVKISPLPFNTEYSEISPTVYNKWLYFVSTMPTTNNKEVHRLNNQPFYNLYGSPIGSDMKKGINPSGGFGKPESQISYKEFKAGSLPNGINRKYHDGPIYVVPSGNMFFFTTSWSKEKRPKQKITDINLLIYYCTKNGNTWSDPIPVPFNSFAYHNQHAFYDESNSTLYYSSDMPGGEGSFDIWKATFKDGSWSKPVNLGPKVNTPREEVFPSIAPDGSLIISSNGWPGLGGLDIFMKSEDDEEPINLTGGLNTERDEFGLYFTERTLAYLTSNRIGSVGDDDIYSAEIDLDDIRSFMMPADRYLNLIVKDSKTNQVLDNVKVTLRGNVNQDYVTPKAVKVLDTITFRELEPAVPKIMVNAEKAGYDPGQLVVESWPQEQELLDLVVLLNPKKPDPVPVATARKPNDPRNPPPAANRNLTTPNVGPNPDPGSPANQNGEDQSLVQVRILDNQKFIIYFNFDKFNIRQDASEILAKVAYVLLEEYSAAQVLLTGHTDTRGSIEYNTRLSKNRVETAKKWLVERGVAASRIRTAYRGEIQLAVYCREKFKVDTEIDKCLTEAEHQLNRRVEIEILNQLDK